MPGATLVLDGVLTPKGFVQLTDTLSSAVGLSPPDGAWCCLIQALVNNVRWRDDGEDPTDAIGMQIEVGKDFWYNGDLTAIKFIEEAASGELNISYYGG